jgi:hypothetical protein
MAQLLGIVQGMQYTGLVKNKDDLVLPNQSVELSNCFASTYALIEDFDILWKNITTFAADVGTLKIVDVLAIDPLHIVGDFTVEWEMCEWAAIFNQFKSMAGLDWSSLADNLSREVLVLVFDAPEKFGEMSKIYDAATCLVDSFDDGKKEKKDKDRKDRDRDGKKDGDDKDGDQWSKFAADGDVVEKALDCVKSVDYYAIGKFTGEFLAKFFNNELKTNV